MCIPTHPDRWPIGALTPTLEVPYPGKDKGREIKIGDRVGGKTVKDIIWTVHLANKKNNNYAITAQEYRVVDGNYVQTGVELGIAAYEDGALPPLRNPEYGLDPGAEERRGKLVTDAGPRALAASTNGAQVQAFDKQQTPCYADHEGAIQDLPDYPVSFPGDHFSLFEPLGPIDTLGEMTVEAGTGRLIVAGGYGRASGIEDSQGQPPSLNGAIDNDGWFDDTSDGPVTAVMLFDDGSCQGAVHGWVVCTDPGYAPQTRNVNSVWDDVYNTWVERLNLVPAMYDNGYQDDYPAAFNGDVLPTFHAAFLQRWNTNLPSKGINGHNFVANTKPGDDPKAKIPSLKQLIRDPNNTDEDDEGVKMPMALGDAMRSFLALSPTQYFLLNQWYDGKSVTDAPDLGDGEKLDIVVLENLLGGRYSPGIDLTFIVRDVNLYLQDWQGATGPFRVNRQPLDYGNACKTRPFLLEGYVPLRSFMVEPGDLGGARLPAMAQTRPAHTLIQAVEKGWWYAGRLPGDRAIVSLTTDTETSKASALSTPKAWHRALQETRWFSRQCRHHFGTDIPRPAAIHPKPMPSAILSAVVGEDWLAVGDAASSYDAMSSAGITKALMHGQIAGRALATYLRDADTSALAAYQDRVFQDFNTYLGLHQQHYRAERRFPHSRFWQRRRLDFLSQKVPFSTPPVP